VSSDFANLFTRAQQTRDLSPLSPLIDAVPAARYLGLALELHGDDGNELRARLDFAPHIVGNALLPAIHGGVIGTLLESAAIYGLLWETRTGRVPKTISITIEFLRSAKATTTWAGTEISHQGRFVSRVRAFAWQDDPAKPVATATAHFLLARD
jgi:uncharacterized protein (TIGR00369 family)